MTNVADDPAVQRLMRMATALVDAISFDMNGRMIGNHFIGGNGGLLSLDTLAKADALRRAVSALEPVEEEKPA